MNQPGVWILGATDDDLRNAGLGDRGGICEPASRAAVGASGEARLGLLRIRPKRCASCAGPDQIIDMVFEKIPSGAGKFNVWLVNGKPYPHEKEFVLKQGARYRLVFHNRTDDSHPLHIHRHSFEIAEHRGKSTTGVIKDTVIVPAVRPDRRRLYRRPARAHALPLPHPAAYGLRLQSAVSLRLIQACQATPVNK